MPEKWNHRESVLKDLSRSNSAIENYNGKLNIHFQAKRPRLSQLIKVLRSEDNLATKKMEEYLAHRSQGLSLTGRKNIHKANDKDIRAEVEHFSSLYDADDLSQPDDATILSHLDALQRLLNRNRFDDILRLEPEDDLEDEEEEEEDIELLRAP